MKVATPQNAKVTDSIIRKAPIKCQRTAGSVNKSWIVNRVSPAFSPSITPPASRSACAARRRSCDASQRGDSGMLRRIHNTISAGNTPIR